MAMNDATFDYQVAVERAEMELWDQLKEILPAIGSAIPQEYEFEIEQTGGFVMVAMFYLQDGSKRSVGVTAESVCIYEGDYIVIGERRPGEYLSGSAEKCLQFSDGPGAIPDIAAAITFVNRALR